MSVHVGSEIGKWTVAARRRRRFPFAIVTAASATLLVLVMGVGGAAAGAGRPRSTSTASLPRPTNQELGIPARPHRGGTLTVLEGSAIASGWESLDPGGPGTVAYGGYMDAIFGELFDLGPHGTRYPDLATGYQYSNGGKTITIYLHKGVRFSDGTKFDSAAVKWNWERDLKSPSSSKPVFSQKTPPVIATHGPYTISMTLQYIDGAFINGLLDQTFNWIGSPTAEQKMGEKAFSLKPVGAGPFEVVSDTPSNSLVLKRNPHYFLKGLPYLNTLVFKSVANDEAGLEGMLAGSGQAYEYMKTPSLLSAFKAHFRVTTEPPTSVNGIQLNTAIPPFNNLQARQAVYYAIDCQLLDQKLFGDIVPCGQSFEAPGGLFYEKKVPGYLTYNPAKAKSLVKQLGGLTFNLFDVTGASEQALLEGLQTEFQAVGMKVTISQYDLATLINTFLGGKWQAALQGEGAWDPASGIGLDFRYGSTSPFSGVHNSELDQLLAVAAGTTDLHKRQTYYNAVAEYLARNADGPFLFAYPTYDVVTHGAGAPGLSDPIPSVEDTPTVLWQYAYRNA